MSSSSCDHDDLLQLPVIDLSAIDDLKPGRRIWELTSSAVGKALEEHGCFEVLYDKVTSDLQRSLYATMEDFFNLPSETKHLFGRRVSRESPFGGYTANLPHSPYYQAVELSGVPNLDLASPLWSGSHDSSAGIIESYRARISELEKTVKKLAFHSLGVGKYLDSHVESASFSLRMAKYEATDRNESEEAIIGLVPHTDMDFISILHDNQAPGGSGLEIEVSTKNGEQHWIKATPSPSSFIVLVGQSLRAWSNGRFHCPRHRVVVGGKQVRYSVGLFSRFTDTIIESPEELVDDQHPLQFKPFYWTDLVRFYSQIKDRHLLGDILTAYCGV